MKIVLLVLAVALTGTSADVSHLSGIQTVLHEDGYHYDKPNVPFPPPPSVDKKEEYLPPPPAAPLCDNGASDSSYPYCCQNGAKNEFCCTGRYVNPTCSPPPTQPPTTRYVPPVTTPRYVPPPPPQPLCDNGAPDSAYPDCCTNGGRGAFCCDNGANNEFCCTGRYVNPTCSAPPTQPPTTRYVPPVTTPRYVPPPTQPPPQPLCNNGAPDSAYPDCCTNGGRGAFCCDNGANNEYCCTGRYVNPTCSAPPTQPQTTRYVPPVTTPRYIAPTTQAPIYLPPETTRRAPPPPPQYEPLCDNGASDSSYPYCCENGAKNEFCCTGRYVNENCSPPATQPPTTRYVPPVTTTRYVPPPTQPPRQPLCNNGAPDSAYPDCCTNGGRGAFCCDNGANNEYCCTGRYVNPTCSAPPTQPQTTRYNPPVTTPRYVPPPPPPPPQPLCNNRAPDSSYPYCCSNGARNEFCCSGPYVNENCSPPPTVDVQDNYLPPCGNGGTGPNCDTASGYNYGRPAIAFRY